MCAWGLTWYQPKAGCIPADRMFVVVASDVDESAKVEEFETCRWHPTFLIKTHLIVSLIWLCSLNTGLTFLFLFLVTVIVCISSIFNSILILIKLIGIKHSCQIIRLRADIPYLVTISKVLFIYLLGLYHGLIVIQHLYEIHRAPCAYVLISLQKQNKAKCWSEKFARVKRTPSSALAGHECSWPAPFPW
jgi:hypothetical protein